MISLMPFSLAFKLMFVVDAQWPLPCSILVRLDEEPS